MYFAVTKRKALFDLPRDSDYNGTGRVTGGRRRDS